VKRHAPARILVPRLAGLALLGAGAVLGSCNIVAPIGYIVHGPEKIPEEYVLDTKRVTAVFIDDTRASVLPSRAVRSKIGETAENMLLNEAKIEKMISSKDVMGVADREKYSKQMGIAEIGEAVGADVIVYVTMQSFDMLVDGEYFTPTATASIRVVDVKEKKQLFPAELEKSRIIKVETPPRSAAMPKSTSERTRAQLVFAERVGREIAHVFIAHTRVPEEGLLDH
jgi:hypothetical protein